jgi:PAS domain-containing protein
MSMPPKGGAATVRRRRAQLDFLLDCEEILRFHGPVISFTWWWHEFKSHLKRKTAERTWERFKVALNHYDIPFSLVRPDGNGRWEIHLARRAEALLGERVLRLIDWMEKYPKRRASYLRRRDKILARKRLYYEQVKDDPEYKRKMRERAKKWCALNPKKAKASKARRNKRYHEGHKDEERARRKAYYEKNREVERAKARDYYQSNTKASAARTKAWRAKNRDKVRSKDAERRARRRDERWRALLAAKGDSCALCGVTYPRVVYVIAIPDALGITNGVRQILEKGSEATFASVLAEAEIRCANCDRLVRAGLLERT